VTFHRCLLISSETRSSMKRRNHENRNNGMLPPHIIRNSLFDKTFLICFCRLYLVASSYHQKLALRYKSAPGCKPKTLLPPHIIRNSLFDHMKMLNLFLYIPCCLLISSETRSSMNYKKYMKKCMNLCCLLISSETRSSIAESRYRFSDKFLILSIIYGIAYKSKKASIVPHPQNRVFIIYAFANSKLRYSSITLFR
jgi:hypothetical protein